MGITPASRNSPHRSNRHQKPQEPKKLFGITYHSSREIKLSARNPGYIISMRNGRNILFENTLATEDHIIASVAVVLDSRRSFAEICRQFNGDLVPFVFQPRSKAFAFMRVNPYVGHMQMINTLLLARDRHLKFDDTERASYFLTTDDLLMAGRFSVDTSRKSKIYELHSSLWATSHRHDSLENGHEVRDLYLRFALALKEFGCPEDLPIAQHIAPAGLIRFNNYLGDNSIHTLGDIIRVFGPIKE